MRSASNYIDRLLALLTQQVLHQRNSRQRSGPLLVCSGNTYPQSWRGLSGKTFNDSMVHRACFFECPPFIVESNSPALSLSDEFGCKLAAIALLQAQRKCLLRGLGLLLAFQCSAHCMLQLYLYAGNAARRKGASSSRTKAATLSDATPIAEAVQACCQLLGRSPGAAEAELAQRLEQNWFSTAKEAASMSEVHPDRFSLTPSRKISIFRNISAPRLCNAAKHHGLITHLQ